FPLSGRGGTLPAREREIPASPASHEASEPADRRPARSVHQKQPQADSQSPAPEQEEPRRSRPHYRRHRSHNRGGQSSES
ncbi:MAG: hypothetical protein LUH09_00105, partial [Clostridiales bacterium]|nr:hypothetical protein [Clostridiales bacterium]